MRTSETISQLAAALAAAQGAFGAVPRDSYNPFFGSAYSDLASVFKGITPAALQQLLRGLKAVRDNERDAAR